MTTKKAYSTPKLIVHGDIVRLTQRNSTGEGLDADFPRGTKKGDLTFS